jgi:Protein of unknown function (DUF4019)
MINEKLQQFTARFNRSVFVTVFVVAFCFLASCSSSKNVQLAEDSVGMFHAQLDTEQYSSIYKAADEKFHSAASENDFVKLLHAVHNKLGSVKKSSLVNTGVAWFAGQGATVTLVYDTQFSDGTGREQFVWHIKDDQASLYGYRINSNDLITK